MAITIAVSSKDREQISFYNFNHEEFEQFLRRFLSENKSISVINLLVTPDKDKAYQENESFYIEPNVAVAQLDEYPASNENDGGSSPSGNTN